MKIRKTVKCLSIILFALFICIGALLIARPQLQKARRQAIMQDLIDQIQNGKTNITLDDVPVVENGEYEFDLDAASTEPKDRTPSIEVTGYGVIEIPSIDLAMPLVQGCDEEALRAAAGWYMESAEPGAAGNCVILGHRMYGYGEYFNRLDEVKEGDEVIVTLADKSYYVYTVTGSEVIDPDTLLDTLKAHNEGFTLTLVTCTPTGVGSHRLLVYANLTEQKTNEEK